MITTGRQQLAVRSATLSSEFRLTPMPKLREHLSGNNLTAAAASFDAANAEWLQSTQRAISDHLAQIRQLVTPK